MKRLKNVRKPVSSYQKRVCKATWHRDDSAIGSANGTVAYSSVAYSSMILNVTLGQIIRLSSHDSKFYYYVLKIYMTRYNVSKCIDVVECFYRQDSQNYTLKTVL